MWDVENSTDSDGEWFPLERRGAETVSCVGSIVSCKLLDFRHPPSDCLFAPLFIRANEQCTDSGIQKTQEDLE